MLRIFVLAHREYLNRVLTTGYWLGIGALLLLLGLLPFTVGAVVRFEAGTGHGRWGVLALSALLWLGVVGMTPLLLTCIVEERANRTAEALLSCLSPLQILLGKMMGTAATALTAVATAAVLFFLLVRAVSWFPDGLAAISLPSDPTVLVWLFSYFVLGFLLYATLLAWIGSSVRNLRQAHALTVPVTIALLLLLPIVVATDHNPNAMLARVFSYVPPLTPFVMMRRVVSQPSSVDLLITTALLVGVLALGTWRLSMRTRLALTPSPG